MSDDKETQQKKGTEHPISLIIDEVVSIFSGMGFEVATGPELEDEWHNFDALNVSKDHPARDMQDTFFIKGNSLDASAQVLGGSQPDHSQKHARESFVLRTHTSGVQIRYMEQLVKDGKKPPFAIVVPGKVFRNESTDAGHEMQFFQLEGLMIGKDINVANLKYVLTEFFKKFLGEDAEIRLRPSFFPFVEPGFEVDVKHNGKWMELLGAGMVHPNVIKNCGLDPKEWQGFAFGFGIDRLTIVKFGIPDIRLFYQGDLRLNQF
ncbi:MAG: phenylalanine--tRNA ligase subunit alpha [Patescibacteria group bacterium]